MTKNVKEREANKPTNYKKCNFDKNRHFQFSGIKIAERKMDDGVGKKRKS